MRDRKYLNLETLRTNPLFVNIASLGLVQMANYAIPILIIPFIVRALGLEFYGKAAYAQNIIAYLTIIVNYGFEYSATQDVAIHRDDKSKLRTIFWTVIRFKAVLLFISFILLGILYFTFSKVHEDPLLYFYAALLNIGYVIFPTWFFQGVEKMKNMALFNFAIKALGAILAVLLVTAPFDYRNYVLILSLSYVVVGVFSFLYLIKKYDLLPGNKDKDLSKQVIRKGFPIFLNNVFVCIYSIAGTTIIGFYLSDAAVGVYSGSHKLIMGVMMLTSTPVNVALFPVMSRKFNESKKKGLLFFRKSLLLVTIGGFLVSLAVFLTAPYLIQIFFGERLTEAIQLLRLFSPIPLLVIIASMFTVQGLYALQMQKYAPFIGVFLALSSIILNFILIPKIGINGGALSWGLAEVLEIIIVGTLFMIKTRKAREMLR